MAAGDHQTKVLKGDEARALLHVQIAQHSGGLHAALAPFEAQAAVEAWMGTLRAIEEFINLPLFGLDDDVIEAALVELPVNALQSRPRRLRAVRHHIAVRYGEAFAQRFTTLLIQAAAMGQSFALHGIRSAAGGFLSVGTAIGYFQSRRRHLVAMLYTLPHACRGSRRMHPLDTLNQLLPLVELNGVTLTGIYQQLMMAEAFDDHALMVDQNGFSGSREYPALDSLYLEPERASIVDMLAAGDPQAAHLEPVRRDRLFSAAELRNDIRLLEAAYAEFNLASSGFAPAADLVCRLSELAIDDHWIRITQADFYCLADAVGVASASPRASSYRDELRREYEQLCAVRGGRRRAAILCHAAQPVPLLLEERVSLSEPALSDPRRFHFRRNCRSGT